MARPLVAVLRLIRLPGCLTAAADSVTAALCVAALTGRGAGFSTLLAIGAASFGIYAFGIVFGDLRDVARDADRHPGRPLPSGAVSPGRARAIAGIALIGSLGAAVTLGLAPLLLALITAATVLAHLLVMKKTDTTASLGMAGCRMSNLLLGASAAGVWTDLPLLVLVATGLYVFSITAISAFEDRRGSRALFVLLVVALLTAILLPFPAFKQAGFACGFPLATAAPLFLILLRRAAHARVRREPAAVGMLVGRGVTGIVLLDATYLFGFGHAPAAVAMVILYIFVRMVLGPFLST